jgi:hypothetical protein
MQRVLRLVNLMKDFRDFPLPCSRSYPNFTLHSVPYMRPSQRLIKIYSDHKLQNSCSACLVTLPIALSRHRYLDNRSGAASPPPQCNVSRYCPPLSLSPLLRLQCVQAMVQESWNLWSGCHHVLSLLCIVFGSTL